jgi:uncharacterized membrane protein
MRGVRVMVSWVLALFLCAMFLLIADRTLFGGASGGQAVFSVLRDASGISQFEPTGRLVVGGLEVLAALLILLPWTRRIGAIFGLLIGAGAVVMAAQMVMQGINVPLPGGSAAAPDTLLYLALALGVISLLLAVVHPGGNADSSDYYEKR